MHTQHPGNKSYHKNIIKESRYSQDRSNILHQLSGQQCFVALIFSIALPPPSQTMIEVCFWTNHTAISSFFWNMFSYASAQDITVKQALQRTNHQLQFQHGIVRQQQNHFVDCTLPSIIEVSVSKYFACFFIVDCCCCFYEQQHCYHNYLNEEVDILPLIEQCNK